MANDGIFTVNWDINFDVKVTKKNVLDAVLFASRTVAERWLSDSKDYVPVLTGALKDSGYVARAKIAGSAAVRFSVFYNTRYAEKQHEEEFNHPSLGFFGRAAYLTKPLEANKDFYEQLFALAMKRYLERNQT